MRSANNVVNAGPHVRPTFLNDVFTFLTEVGNAGHVVNTGTSSVNSEFVTALIYVIFYLFLVNIIGNCHENKYIYNTCALSKHMGNMCMRLTNAGKGEASPSLFLRFAPNTHIYLYASTVHMYCIYPAILNRK